VLGTVPDADLDARPKAVPDGGSDTDPDAVPDGLQDAVPDAASEAGSDARRDAGPNVGPDTDSGAGRNLKYGEVERSVEPVDVLWRGQLCCCVRLAQEGFGLLLIHRLGGELSLYGRFSKALSFSLLHLGQLRLSWLQSEGRVHQASTILLAWGARS